MSDKPPKNFYVYCVFSKYTDERNLKKLGLTIHPTHRLRQYATGDAPGCDLDKQYNSLWRVNANTRAELHEMEKILHKHFADKRQDNSEWFRVSFEEVEAFMKKPQKFQLQQLSYDEVKNINTKYKQQITSSEKAAYDEEAGLMKVQKLNCVDKQLKSMSKPHKYLIKGSNINIPCLISKPEQGKKTIEVAKIIKDDIKNNDSILSIFFSQSRKNQSNNAAKNFQEHILNQLGIDEMPNLHGDKDSSKDPKGFLFGALHENKRLIAALANKSRTTVAKDIIKGWLGLNKRNIARIYIDEAQKTISTIILHLYRLLNKDEKNRVQLILIDAHIKAILENKDFKREFGLGLNKRENEYNLSDYLFLSSMPIIKSTWKTTDDILESYKDGSLEINIDDYVLWPLPFKKIDQHKDATAIIQTINDTCLLLINGDGYYIYSDDFPDGKYISKKNCKLRDCQSEACSSCNPSLQDSELMIVMKLKEKYAKTSAFILSGHHCIDRAMTYHTAKRPFTKVLTASEVVMKKSYFDTGDKSWSECQSNKQEDISQMLKRACGSFKEQLDLNNIPYPTFYMSEDIWDGLLVLEKISTVISTMTGIIDMNVYNDIASSVTTGNEVKARPRTVDDLKNPTEYYFKTFNCSGKTDKEIQVILTEFREKIGGEKVHLRSISDRLNPKKGSERYVEDIGKKTPLILDDFKKEGGFKLLECGLDKDTMSRIRICWDNDTVHFAIHWRQEINIFTFDKKKHNIVPIDPDGNCLFTCFIKGDIYKRGVGRFRGDVANYLEDNSNKYSKYIAESTPESITSLAEKIRKNGEWNDGIMDLLPYIISDLLKVNIFIYKFNSGFESGGEEVLFDTPISIPEKPTFQTSIHLKYSNGNHYDLFKSC
jgi:hypothetical protein